MSTTTTNLGLVKPALTDNADITIVNSNMDTIDAAVGLKAPISSPNFTGIVKIPINSTSDGLLISLNSAVAAAGTTQATATALTKDMNVVTTGTGGVVVQGATTGKVVVIINRTSSAINVYPAVGHYFDGLSVNTPISLPTNGFIELYGFSTTQWNSTINAVTNAKNVQIADTGNIITATNTEDALQEVVGNVNVHLADAAHEAGKFYAYKNIGGAL
jgi:hypothetical protein